MSEFKGTPGPWDYDTALDAVFNKNCLFICDVSDRANAHLIAAAPELLGVLQELTVLCEHDEGCRNLTEYKRAKAAIAKALGETK